MKLIHIADLHLGYRAYHRTDPRGINIREADVARAFRETLDRSVNLAPDLLLIAGDVFHTARPSNTAIADAFRQFSRFVERRPETPVVIIAGDHDSPKAAETGNILKLFGEISNVHVVHEAARRLFFPELDAAVLCLPHNALAASPTLAIEPEPAAANNVLVAHAGHATHTDEWHKLLMGFGGAMLPDDAINPDDWSYVALGHYHVRSKLTRESQLASNMFYAGAIERTSLNIWAEADDNRPTPEVDPWPEADWGKGFVEYDLEAQQATFHAADELRPVLDLPPVLDELSPGELDAEIESRLAGVGGDIDGKIIRLRVFNTPRSVYRELDHSRLRGYRTRALHFHLDVRPPDIVRSAGSAAPGRRLTLQEELVAFLKHRWRPEAENVDREALIELGTRYLEQAEVVGAQRGSE